MAEILALRLCAQIRLMAIQPASAIARPFSGWWSITAVNTDKPKTHAEPVYLRLHARDIALHADLIYPAAGVGKFRSGVRGKDAIIGFPGRHRGASCRQGLPADRTSGRQHPIAGRFKSERFQE